MVRLIETFVFRNRPLILALFVLATIAFAYGSSQLRIDAGFEKQLPIGHPYMETYRQYQDEFGGANRVLIAVRAETGDIFTNEFMETLRQVTDEVFFIPGIARDSVRSIFTPNVRFTEIVEDGFAGGNVIPADFQALVATPEELAQVRENILKSGQVGRLVAEDFSAAIVSAQLQETARLPVLDPDTGEPMTDPVSGLTVTEIQPLDYFATADLLEDIRQRFQTDEIDIHIIGFVKVVGDIADGAVGVITFFAIAVAITAVMVFVYSVSIRLTILPIVCSLVAVVWQLGLVTYLGYGLDPMSILVPFLVFAIGVSHGVQMINAVSSEVLAGGDKTEAARHSFRRLLVPGGIALLSDTIGFLTILLIQIRMIQELAITASIGVAVIILTNLFLLPVLLSYVDLGEGFRERYARTVKRREPVWRFFANFARVKWAVPTVLVAALLFGWALYEGRNMAIGDLEAGVPELWPDSRYNQDTQVIIDSFSIGVDVIQVITEVYNEDYLADPAAMPLAGDRFSDDWDAAYQARLRDSACIEYDIIRHIDDFEWHLANVPGVQGTISLPNAMKIINAGWNEGHPAWRVLPRDFRVLARAQTPIETSTGLLNADCSVMPILAFTEDHKAETIDRVIAAVESFRSENPNPAVDFRLATGNVGVMAATNQAVQAAQLPMLLWVYGAIVALCLLTFRSVWATFCTVAPLTLVSALCYALMSLMDIGLKVSTLPVAALGVGIGVDYGIYIFSRMRNYLKDGMKLPKAYYNTLQDTGSAVLFTGLTLAVGVSTWIFSALKFQADMGILLTFMFLVNMLGAILVLPALAALIGVVIPWNRRRVPAAQPVPAE